MCDWLKPSRSPRLMAPKVGLSAQLAQKLAGRIMEPTSWVPSATGTMPAPTTAPEPLDDPPGVRLRSKGLFVGPGSGSPMGVVTVLPSTTAPALRSARMTALSLLGKLPWNRGLPIWVGMSLVSIRSLTPSGMPSISDSGRPAL